MSKAREVFNKPTKWDDYYRVKNDPLTIEQQIKMIDYAYDYIYALLRAEHKREKYFIVNEQKHYPYDFSRNIVTSQKFEDLSSDVIEKLAQECDQLPDAPLKIGKESFKTLFAVMKDPSLKAKDFGLENDAQIYAARILLKCVFESPIRVKDESLSKETYSNFSTNPYFEAMLEYKANLTNDPNHGGGYTVRNPTFTTYDGSIGLNHLINMGLVQFEKCSTSLNAKDELNESKITQDTDIHIAQTDRLDTIRNDDNTTQEVIDNRNIVSANALISSNLSVIRNGNSSTTTPEENSMSSSIASNNFTKK